MKYDISEIQTAMQQSGAEDWLILNVLANLPKKRTTTQNAALHVYCSQLASAFNEMGQTFNYKGISGKEIEIPWTGELVKEHVWKPLQRSIYEDETTTRLTTEKINGILNVLGKWLAEKMGIYVEWPSLETINNNV